MKRTAVLVLALLAVTAHAQRSSSRSSDESPRSSRGSRKFDSLSAREELGVSTQDWEAAVTPALGAARSSGSRRASSASRSQPQAQPQQAAPRRRTASTAPRARVDPLQSLEAEQVAASSVIAPVVTQQFVSRRPTSDKSRSAPSRRRDADAAPAAAAPSRRRPQTASGDSDAAAAALEPTTYSRRRPTPASSGDQEAPSTRRRASTASLPTAAPAPVFEAPEEPSTSSTTTTTTTTTAAPVPETPPAPERVVPARFDSSRRRSGGSSSSSNSGGAAEPEATFAPRQRGGGRRSGGGSARRGGGGVASQDSEAAPAPSRERSRGGRREQQPAAAASRATASRGRGSARSAASSTTSTTTTTTTTTSTTTAAPLPTNPDTEVAPELNGGDEDSNAVQQQPDAAAEESTAQAQELPQLPVSTEASQAAGNPRRKAADDGGAARQPVAPRRGSVRSRGGASAGDDGRSATTVANSRRSGSRGGGSTRNSIGQPAPADEVLPTGAGAPATFARTSSRRASPRSRPTAVDLTTADTSQNDVQPRSSIRGRSHVDSVPNSSSSGRRSNRRGSATPDVDASGNSAGGASVQRTSRKINPDTNARPSFKNTRRGTSSKKLATEATSIKDEIDESENYPPEFIQKIKSSVDTKDVKTTQSSLLTSSSEDTFITKSSDKVVSVLTPSLPEDDTNAADDKENQNNDVVQNKLETRRRSNKYTGRARSYKIGSNEAGKQRKVDLLLAPSPPSEREVTTPTVRSSPQSQYKSSSGYSLRGTKKDTASEDTNKVETPSPATPDTLQLDSPVTSPTQSTRTAFRTKSNLRSHHTSKLEKENIVTAPGGPFIQNAQDPSTRPSFRRAFPTRSRSAAYKSHPPRNEQPSASTEDNIISSRSYTPRPNTGKTRTTSSFRRSIAATTDDIQNEIQTSAQPPATPRSLVGTPRFSARFRNDLLLATGGLRSTTTTPAYIPTVPLIRAASTTTTETSAENPSEGLTLDKSSLTMTGDNLLDDSFQGRLKLDNDVSFHLDNSTEMNHVDEETVTYSASSSSAPVTKMTSLSPASDYNNENSQEATITTTAAAVATTTTTEITNSVLTTLNPKIVVPNSPLSQTTSSIISDLSHSPLNESSETAVMTEVPEIRSTTFLSTSTNTRLPSSTQKKKLPLRKEFAIALLKIVSRVNRPTVPLYVTTVTSNLNEETTVPYSPPTTTAAEMISELSQQDITTFSPHVTLQAKKITTRAVTYSPEVVSSATVGTTPQSSTEEVKATSIKSTTEKMPEVTSEVVRSTSTSPTLSSSLLSLSPDVVNSTAATSNSAVALTETTLSEIVTVASTTETLISTVSEIKPPTSTKAVNILAVNNPQADFSENITNEIKTSSSNNVVHTSNSSAPEVLKIRNSEIRFVTVDRPPLESDNLVTESSHDFSTSVKGPVLLGQSTTSYSSTEQVSASSTVQIPSASSTLNNSSQSTSAEMLKMINTTVSVDKGPPNNHALASIQPINLTPSASLNASTISMSITEPSKLITESVTQSVLSSTETDSLASTRFPVRITIAPRGTASTTIVPPLVERQVSNDPVAQRRLVDDVNDENQYFASSSNYRTTTTVRTPLPFVIFGIFPNNTVFRKYPHSGKTEQVSENEIARHQEYYPEEQTSQTSSTTSVTGDPIANEILYRNALRNSVQTSLPHATVNTRLPAGRNPSENDVAWVLGTRTSIPIPPAQSEIDSGQQTEMINDSKKITPGSETIVASASDRALIPTVTQRIQPPVTFAFPSEVSNSVYNVQGSKYSNYWSSSTTEKPKFHYITSNYISAEIPTSTSIPLYIVTPEPATSSTAKVIYKWKPVIDKQNLVEKMVDNGISSTTTENLNTATQSPISTNTQTVPSTTVSSTEAKLPLSSSTMTTSQTTAKIVAGVTTLETISSVPSGISNSQDITTPVISSSEPTDKLSTVERIGSTLSSSVPIINKKVTVTASVTTERVLSQSATSPPPPLSIRGLISRVLGNISPSITTASTASPVMTVTAKRQLTAMTSLPVSSYITERLVTVTPMVPLTNNSSSEPALTPKPATSQPTTAKAVSAIESTVQATTTEAITVKPTTLKSTLTIATSLKTTTSEPTTLKPTLSKPSTPKPTTPKPTTAKPTTSKPTTPKTTTPKPTTSKPTTPKPTPAKSTKSIPTTPKPATSKPTTPKPTTSKPNTSKPTTSKPTTPKPTTSKPTAPKPTTSKATTPKPTTPKPTTPKPTTPKPTTPKPTTAKPTTPKPTTPKPTTPKPTTPKPTTPKATTSQPATPKPSTSKPSQITTPPQPLITSPRNSFTYSSLNTLESDIKHVESESVDERNSWQTLDRQGSLEELSLLNILAQNVGGRKEQKKTNLADKVIEAALQRSSTTTSPLFNNNVPKTKVVQTLENGVESNRFSLDLLGQQSRNINADDVTDAPAVTSSILELDTSKSTPVVSSKSPTVETVTSGKLSPQDEQLLLALFGNQISAAVQQPKSQNTRSRSRLSPEEQLLAALLRQQATADLKTASKGSQQQKEQIPAGLSLSTTSPRPKSQRLPVSGKISEEELLLSLLGGQPKTTQKATEQVNSTRPKLSDEEILAALLSGQSKGATRTVATTQRVSTKPRRLLTDEQIIAGLLAGSTPASPADQSRLNELLNGGRHKARMTTTTPAVPRGLGFLTARPGSQGLFSSALQPDAGSLDPGVDLGEDGIRGPREQGTLVKAAIDVTKAVSQFMSAVIQGATRSFQSFFRSGTSLLSQYFSLGSAQAGNFQLR